MSTSMVRCPKSLEYQFKENMFRVSDKCCYEMKEKTLKKWGRENHKTNSIIGIMADEGGRRALTGKCILAKKGRVSFAPLIKVTKEWEEWFIEKYNIRLCELYYPPYNFERTGCKGCPFSINLQDQLEVMERMIPNERKQCEIIWKPVYEEYRRIGYRLKKNEQTKLF